MDYESKLSNADLEDIRQELVGLMEHGYGRATYATVAERLGMLMVEVNTKQIKRIIIETMKAYANRLALLQELSNLLTKKERTAFEAWRKNHKKTSVKKI